MDMVTLTARLPADLKKRIEGEAAAQGKTLVAVVREALVMWSGRQGRLCACIHTLGQHDRCCLIATCKCERYVEVT